MVLVVDLDETLVRTDLLVESFLSALGRRPLPAVAALAGLRRGRAALKARLAGLAEIDVATLPYDPAVIERLRAARARGEATALVSASDARLVRAVADHLGLFDEAHGSEEGRNLKGAAKAAFLVERYGQGGFDYIADAPADLAVWREARRAISLGAGPGLRAALEAVRPDAEHLAPRPGLAARLAPYLRAMRPHQWLKNLLVFVPALAAHATDAASWGAAALAFVLFSLTASGVYLLNDLLDLGADRAHPRKRARPFAAGRAAPLTGLVLAALLPLAAISVALVALPGPFALVLTAYYAVTLAYSLALKRLLMLDIITLAMLYSMRVVAGGVACAIALSPWLLAFSGFLFCALAAMKRQTELVDLARSGRSEAATRRAYRGEDLPVVTMIAVAAGMMAVLVLALYADSAEIRRLYTVPELLWAACPVLLYWVARMVLLAQRGEMDDDPVSFAARDRVSLLCAGLMLAVLMGASLF